jgi:hypothetical protein
MLRKIGYLVLTLTLLLGLALSAQAITAIGPTSLQNGFPTWWEDEAGFRVGMCLDPGCAPDPVEAANPFSEQIGFGGEAFWWLAETTTDDCNALLVLAMEAAFNPEVIAPDNVSPFARIRVRADTTVGGEHTITTPFNTIVVQADAGIRGINVSQDIGGPPTTDPPFSGVLASDITHFFRAGPEPAPGAVFSGAGAITSAPLAGAGFSISGPGCTTSTDTFATVAGQSFNDGNNLSPFANHDLGATTVGAAATLDLAANDVDVFDIDLNVHGINPRAVGLGAAMPFVFGPGNPANLATPGMATSGGGRVAKNPNGTVNYLPAATFTGIDTFAYVIQDTGGCISGQLPVPDPLLTGNDICLQPDATTIFTPATAIVTVEQLQASAALRTKIQKWDISGSSTVANLSTSDVATGDPILFTNLSGAFEVPPVASAGTGSATFTIRGPLNAPTSIDFTLEAAGLTTAINASHIHTGAFGVNGGVIVTLFDAASPGTLPGIVTGTITAADVGAPFTGDLTALVAAMQAGNTYVNLHTAAVPSGEIRGQIGRNGVAVHNGADVTAPVLGAAAVQAGGSWTLPEKLLDLPASSRNITVQSTAGNVMTVPVKLK